MKILQLKVICFFGDICFIESYLMFLCYLTVMAICKVNNNHHNNNNNYINVS